MGKWNNWTLVKCMAEARKYATKLEYQRAKGSGYSFAYKRGWLPQCTIHMPAFHRKWTRKSVIAEAKKFKTRMEWLRKSGGSYGHAVRHGYFEACVPHMKHYRRSSMRTLEQCRADALQYTKRIDYKRKSKGSYFRAFRMGWLDEVCAHMIKPKPFTLQDCMTDALKYQHKSDWSKSAYYRTARKNKWLPQCTAHMMRKKRAFTSKWTKELCVAESKKYKTNAEWINNNEYSYKIANRMGWLPECRAHMNHIPRMWRNVFWTMERCMADAKKYKFRSEWAKNRQSAYQKAKRKGWFEQCVEHMRASYSSRRKDTYKRTRTKKWTLERCLEEAKKHKTKSEWIKASITSYQASRKWGYFQQCISHMTPMVNKWTKEECIVEAKKYKSKREWDIKDNKSYQGAYMNGWLHLCTGHMSNKNYWTLARCKRSASHFSSRLEWVKKNRESYDVAYQNGWLNECDKQMKK